MQTFEKVAGTNPKIPKKARCVIVLPHAIAEEQDQIRTMLLGLPSVTGGRRFGGEAFFYRNKFFCHFHPAGSRFFLETFVWNRIDEVVREIPGVIPHPGYGNYGWVRLLVSSESDLARAKCLVDRTYRYLRTTRRISLSKDRFTLELLARVKAKMSLVSFKTKVSKKRIQIVMVTPELFDYDRAETLLNEAARMLRNRDFSDST